MDLGWGGVMDSVGSEDRKALIGDVPTGDPKEVENMSLEGVYA